MERLRYIMLLLVVTILAGCASKKDLRTLEMLTIADVSVTPNVWKQDGNQVPFQMQIQIQPNQFHKKWELTLLPQVETAVGVQKLTPMVFAGQKIKSDNAITVPKKDGYNGTQSYSFAYNPAMQNATLTVVGILTKKGKEIARYMWKPYESTIIAQKPKNENINKDEKKLVPGMMMAVVTFKVNSANILAGIPELSNAKKHLESIFSYKGAYLTKVLYTASCSPEGPLALNQKLVKERLAVGQKILNEKLNLSSYPGYNNPGVVQTEMIAENWQSLYNLIEDSNMANKYQMLDALKKAPNLQARENILYGYIAKYPAFKNQYLVELRTVWVTIEYMVPAHKIKPTQYPPIGPFTR